MAKNVTGNNKEKPALQAGVLWYKNDPGDLIFVVNRYLRNPQITRLATAFDIEMFRQCNGNNSITAIASASDTSADRIARSIEKWENLAPGMFQWLESSEDRQRQLKFLQAATILRSQWKAAHEDAANNIEYYTSQIDSASQQFEHVETTISHAFRNRHRALGGRSYGEAFCDKLTDLRALRPNLSILEIGCGTGRFANDLLDRMAENHPEIYSTSRYTLFDISNELQSSQKELCKAHRTRTRFMLGNIEDHSFQDEEFDLIIANEMIADLRIGIVRAENLKLKTVATEAEQIASEYRLECSPGYKGKDPAVAVNVGAIRLIEQLPQWLSPSGIAVITEYGSENEFPEVLEMSDHKEWSIHFGHLMQVADRLSLTPELDNLGAFLNFDGDCETIGKPSYFMLSEYLLPFLGKERLRKIAYDRETLREELGRTMDRIGNLRFYPLSEVNLFNPFDFRALILRA